METFVIYLVTPFLIILELKSASEFCSKTSNIKLSSRYTAGPVYKSYSDITAHFQ